MLEANCHEHNAFLTLTYDNDHLPADGSVDPTELQLFMKKLRWAYRPQRIRFYGVGEYGETDGRPHYHVALFGMRSCNSINTQVRKRYGEKGVCCEVCTRMRDLWAKGYAFLGQLEPRSASYVAGYVLKKVGGPGLNNGVKPFARMSNRPGIGCFFMDEVASTLLEINYNQPDVPTCLRHGNKKWPLGKYLRRQLRLRIGRPSEAPQSTLLQMEERMRPLQEAARNRPPGISYPDSIRGMVQDLSLGERIKINARETRITRRKTL